MKTFLPGLLFLVIAQGCSTAPVGDKSARAAYLAIESSLLSADVLRVDYEIEARGAVAAKLTGDLVMQKPMLAAINANGVFAGADVAPVFVSNGKRIRGGNARHNFEQNVPAEIRDGLLLGLMRMGILHNLANLSQGAPPEGTDGAVRKWLVVNRFAWQELTRRFGGVDLRGISFAIEVGGEPAGNVVLWYDPVTGLPVEREQVVHFDNGDMAVRERYTIKTGGIIGPCRFDLDTVTAQ